MAAIDEVQGLDREEFNRLYDETNGFIGIPYPKGEDDGEDVYETMKKGAELLINECPEIVAGIKDAFAIR